jgi:hypothetical protein
MATINIIGAQINTSNRIPNTVPTTKAVKIVLVPNSIALITSINVYSPSDYLMVGS